jgi:putative transposase
MNTDQGSQFTSEPWIEAVEASGARVSMDGKGRWMDNVFIERLWRSLKYEELRLWSYGTVAEVTARIAKWMAYYNHRRKHQALDYQIPWSRYRPGTTSEPQESLTKTKFPPRGTEARAA